MPNEEEKNLAYEESKILYEDDNIIFVEPMTLVAAKYFAPEFVVKRWSDYYRSKDTKILYDKNKDIHRVIYKPTNNKINIMDGNGYDVEVDDFEHSYPQVTEFLDEMFDSNSIYHLLKQISDGVKISEYQLKDSDNLIYQYKFNEKNPKKSVVTIRFEDIEDYLKLFDLDDDDIRFVNSLFYDRYSSYGNEFYYSDMGTEDWREGYLIRNLNESNIKKVKDILLYISPNTLALKDDDDEFYRQASRILEEMFPREIDWIITEYTDLEENCRRESAKKEISKDLENKFYYNGIFEEIPLIKYYTTVRVLLNLFETTKKTRGSIHDVLKSLVQHLNVGPYEEYRYEYGCDDFDDEGFNNYVERQLETIEEKISEGEFTSDIKELQKIVDDVITKYGVRKAHRLPKDPEKTFYIDSIDPKTNKIVVVYNNYKGLKGSQQKRSLGLEDFYNFLYHPELFENKKSKKVLLESKLYNVALKWINSQYPIDSLEIVSSEKEPNIIFYKMNGKTVMEQDNNRKIFWFMEDFWRNIRRIFSLNDGEVLFILNNWLEQTLNLEGFTPHDMPDIVRYFNWDKP